jgi:hypothetical protein
MNPLRASANEHVEVAANALFAFSLAGLQMSRLRDDLRAATVSRPAVIARENLALPFHGAQIAEREYCRPHARPFRLGFPRKAPVFPVCSPTAL